MNAQVLAQYGWRAADIRAGSAPADALSGETVDRLIESGVRGPELPAQEALADKVAEIWGQAHGDARHG